MYELYDFSKGPRSDSDLVEKAKDWHFIYLVLVDLNGVPRLTVLPADEKDRLVSDGYPITVSALTYQTNGATTAIPDHVRLSFGDVRLKPVIDTTRPWTDETTAEPKVLQIFAEPKWLNDGEIKADARRLAAAQVKRLDDLGYEFRVGWTVEVRLFKLGPGDGEPVFADDIANRFHAPVIRQYKKFYTEVDKRIRQMGFRFEAFHNGGGPGHLVFSLPEDLGLKPIDDVIRLRMIIHEVALDFGYKASFMTKATPGQTVSHLLCRHSVWQKDGKPSTDKVVENVMFNEDEENKLSEFARQWIAGLLTHAKGLTAIWAPTINCYRALHKPLAPDYADWGVESRSALVCLKKAKTTQLELRGATAAANPYLVVASIIAAGLDGVHQKLRFVAPGCKDVGHLPHNLSEALGNLKKDEAMCSALGEQFIEWFGTIKMEEMSQLGSVDVGMERREDYNRERKAYFDSL